MCKWRCAWVGEGGDGPGVRRPRAVDGPPSGREEVCVCMLVCQAH